MSIPLKWMAAAIALAVSCQAQNVANVVKQGEAVFSKTCATGYCHGVRGGPSGAPRLAARGFNQAYIDKNVPRIAILSGVTVLLLFAKGVATVPAPGKIGDPCP